MAGGRVGWIASDAGGLYNASGMPNANAASRSQVTLVLATVLHTFTHSYAQMLVPLYLLISADLRLPGVMYAAMLVTVYGVTYSSFSYGAGVLADRLNRKNLLGWGLIANAIAVGLMGLTHRYDLLILLAVAAGMAGTLFHPAANALIPAHFPKSPGMAIGLLGIGSGLGFFFGPQYAGWRAMHAGWHFASISNWQKPLVELGAMGLVCGLLFLWIAREVPHAHRSMSEPRPLGARLRWNVIAVAFTLGCRDFAGLAALTVLSIYLQRAHHHNVAETGFMLGSMMLIGVVANPVGVWLSPGRRRLPVLAGCLLSAGVIISVVPLVSRDATMAVLCAFQACYLASYAVSDASILERVASPLRGRVVGLFLTIAGTAAGLSPWVMGFWIDRLGPRASDPLAYRWPFAMLGILMALAVSAVPLIHKLGPAQIGAIEPITEIDPRISEAVA